MGWIWLFHERVAGRIITAPLPDLHGCGSEPETMAECRAWIGSAGWDDVGALAEPSEGYSERGSVCRRSAWATQTRVTHPTQRAGPMGPHKFLPDLLRCKLSVLTIGTGGGQPTGTVNERALNCGLSFLHANLFHISMEGGELCCAWTRGGHLGCVWCRWIAY